MRRRGPGSPCRGRDDRLRQHFRHGCQCRSSVGRNVGLVVPELAARVLPRGNGERGLPLLRAHALGRAQLDGLPASLRGAVRTLGCAVSTGSVSPSRRRRGRCGTSRPSRSASACWATGSGRALRRRGAARRRAARAPARVDLRIALDLRHESREGVDIRPAVRVNDWQADAPFRYLRFREPPHSDDELAALAGRMRPLLAADVDVFAYFRHEDAPTAPGTPRGCSSSSARTTADRSRGRRAQERGVVA